MVKLGARLLFLMLQSTAAFAGKYSGMQEDFLMAFVESFSMDYIMIVRNSSGNKFVQLTIKKLIIENAYCHDFLQCRIIYMAMC
jgi:hypothetical protein